VAKPSAWRKASMTLIGYARISTDDGRQTTTLRQLDELRAAGCTEIAEEHASGITVCVVKLVSPHGHHARRGPDAARLWVIGRCG
jgi:hypothetical protein